MSLMGEEGSGGRGHFPLLLAIGTIRAPNTVRSEARKEGGGHRHPPPKIS